jgi:hypothetical protein
LLKQLLSYLPTRKISICFSKSKWTRKRNFFQKFCKNQGFIISEIHGFCFGYCQIIVDFDARKAFATKFVVVMLQNEYDGAWNASLQATKSEEELQRNKGRS